MSTDPGHLERLYELSPDILCVVGTDGYLRQANPAFERILGYGSDELESTMLLELVHADDLDRTRSEIERARTGEALVKFQVRVLRADGEARWIEWSASPVPERDLIYAVGREITAEKEIEAELRRSEEVHRLTLENASDAVFVTDDRGDFTYVCPNVDVIFGYSQEEAVALVRRIRELLDR